MGTRSWSSRLARGLVALAAPVVPRLQRREWRAEWEGELAAADAGDGSSPRQRRSALAYAVGAPADALWLRPRASVALTVLEDLRHGWRQLRQQRNSPPPFLCIQHSYF